MATKPKAEGATVLRLIDCEKQRREVAQSREAQRKQYAIEVAEYLLAKAQRGEIHRILVAHDMGEGTEQEHLRNTSDEEALSMSMRSAWALTRELQDPQD